MKLDAQDVVLEDGRVENPAIVTDAYYRGLGIKQHVVTVRKVEDRRTNQTTEQRRIDL